MNQTQKSLTEAKKKIEEEIKNIEPIKKEKSLIAPLLIKVPQNLDAKNLYDVENFGPEKLADEELANKEFADAEDKLE